jgi:hypothetical protein
VLRLYDDKREYFCHTVQVAVASHYLGTRCKGACTLRKRFFAVAQTDRRMYRHHWPSFSETPVVSESLIPDSAPQGVRRALAEHSSSNRQPDKVGVDQQRCSTQCYMCRPFVTSIFLHLAVVAVAAASTSMHQMQFLLCAEALGVGSLTGKGGGGRFLDHYGSWGRPSAQSVSSLVAFPWSQPSLA